MLVVSIYRSDEVVPFAVHLCDMVACGKEELTITHEDTITTIKDYDYYKVLECGPQDSSAGLLFISLMKGFANTIQSIDSDRAKELQQAVSYQNRVYSWMLACFGSAISADVVERNHRFLEEALELVQACGASQEESHQLVDYVYGRPSGEKFQEVGGVMVTLAALCQAQDLNMDECAEVELKRVWTKVEQIRAKQAAKPKFSPLPE